MSLSAWTLHLPGHIRAAGTLLQVLELLLAVRQYDTDHGPGEQSYVNPEHGHGHNTMTPPSGGSPDMKHLSNNLGKEVAPLLLKYVWLTKPASSSSPPVKYAMLSVLEAMDDILRSIPCSATFGRDGDGDGGKDNEVWADYRTELRMKLVEAQDSNLESAIRMGSDGRCLPGYSILVSKVVTAGIECRLKHALFDAPCDKVGGTGQVESAWKSSSEHEAERSSSAGSDAPLRFVLDLILDPNVDIRDAAIKAIKKHFGHHRKSHHTPRGAQPRPSNLFEAEAGLPGAALCEVWVAVSKALIHEVHPPNVRRLLRLLARVGGCLVRNALVLAPEITQESALWRHVLNLCDRGNAGEGDIHPGAIEVLGIMVRLNQGSPMLEEEREDEDEDEDEDAELGHRCSSRERSYLARLESASGPAQPINTRASAAESLAFSGLLSADQLLDLDARSDVTKVTEVAEVTDLPRRNPLRLFRMWFVLIRLLQDESEKVRLCAAHAFEASGLGTAMEPRGKTIAEMAGSMETDRSPTMSLGDSTEFTARGGDPCQRFHETASVATERIEGGRPLLRTMELVLDHLLLLAENGARDESELNRQRKVMTVAEQLAVSLLEALSRIPGIAKDGMVSTAGTGTGTGAGTVVGTGTGTGTGTGFVRGKEESSSSRMYPEQFSRIGEEYVAGDVYGTGGDETFGGGREIFERDELVEYEEPLVFARLAAPYLRRSVEIALEVGGRVLVLPAALVHAITMALENLSEILERLSPSLSRITRVTWTPEVFVSFSASMSTAIALLEALESGPDELCDMDVLRKSSARVRLACERFATCCGEDREAVHPDLCGAVYRLLKENRYSRSYTAKG